MSQWNGMCLFTAHRLRLLFGLSVTLAAVSACKANSDSISDFINATENKIHIAKNTQSAPALVRPYLSKFDLNSPSPFLTPSFVQSPPLSKVCQQKSLSPNKVLFSGYSLAELKYRGFVEQANGKIALIQAPSGQLLSARLGQLVGVNQAEIIHIEANSMEVVQPSADDCSILDRTRLSR
ncbi:pilus assembly protein PilP [Vibrio sp. S4M6]|uniref:pilus assembly protein PilP n=1 Tax=Vibrio sinus TaxID=2946865 RepID=UPI002029EFF2|nr:pilus assembly protein PilP [Vibrio sinus]MCL9780433.1 pilus assembly protein PilP [Vibrio sinus]